MQRLSPFLKVPRTWPPETAGVHSPPTPVRTDPRRSCRFPGRRLSDPFTPQPGPVPSPGTSQASGYRGTCALPCSDAISVLGGTFILRGLGPCLCV